MVGVTDGSNGERTGWSLISAKNLAAFNFLFAIQADQPLADRVTGLRRNLGRSGRLSVKDSVDDFAISRAAAQHPANRVHYFGFVGCVILIKQTGGADQHPGSARSA